MTKPDQPWFIRRPIPSPQEIHRVHLIGIAGAGMGAFAGMLQEAGYEVRGSDRGVYPPMSTELSQRGIAWMEGWAAEHLDWNPDLVIVGNVCRRDNVEAVEAERREIPSVSFPQAFSDLFLLGHLSVVVSGTHGKTTTTSLTAWLLHEGGLDPGLLVGGVSRNFESTYRLGQGAPFVVEGDEYDTAYFDKGPKFLHYRPDLTILNNIEFDHADIYDSLDEIVENFDRLIDILPSGGVLFANADDPLVMARAARAGCRVVTYGFGEGATLRATDVVPCKTGCDFVLHQGSVCLGAVSSPLAGRHNVWNTLAAFGVGFELGLDFATLCRGLATFLGTKKRQEEKGEAAGVLIVDDYAHHPTAIDETIRALKARYEGRPLWAVYEPKSNTARRNIHQQDYARCFVAADHVRFARPFVKEDKLLDDQKLDLDRVVTELRAAGVDADHRDSIESLVAHLSEATQSGDVVVFMSSSGFDGIHERLIEALRDRGHSAS